MNVLVTGGAGYIGSELVYQLSQDKNVEKVIVYDNLGRENYNLLPAAVTELEEIK